LAWMRSGESAVDAHLVPRLKRPAQTRGTMQYNEFRGGKRMSSNATDMGRPVADTSQNREDYALYFVWVANENRARTEVRREQICPCSN